MPRERKPTSLKVLHGDRKDRIPKGEPIPPDSGPIEAPEWLQGPAFLVWERYAPGHIAAGTLTFWDVPAFARLCWLEHRTAALMTELEGADTLQRRGERVKNPKHQIRRDLTAELFTLYAKFGMTPADRAKMGRMKEPDDAKKAADLLSS